MNIVTEAMDEHGIDAVVEYGDCIQIGARNMQNFSLLRYAGQTKKPVLLKRGLSATLDELLLAAVSSCFAMALSHAARKRSVEIDGLVVEATGYYEGPSFSAIRVTAVVGCDESQLAGLMSSAERFCYVTNTLRGGVDLTFEGFPGLSIGDVTVDGSAL